MLQKWQVFERERPFLLQHIGCHDVFLIKQAAGVKRGLEPVSVYRGAGSGDEFGGF
ncbi:hypothetical protein FHW00_003895 [Ochrobactrum sp. P6BSIII]|uniref:hypothetical protein n=1 Tax=unclassified Ochrobactrum TaxID=239106 RepID=UPI0013AFFF08|nr:hypothetical protein [Ochrobactrum sp. P6BSIII]